LGIDIVNTAICIRRAVKTINGANWKYSLLTIRKTEETIAKKAKLLLLTKNDVAPKRMI
jgi:hypothetical protein